MTDPTVVFSYNDDNTSTRARIFAASRDAATSNIEIAGVYKRRRAFIGARLHTCVIRAAITWRTGRNGAVVTSRGSLHYAFNEGGSKREGGRLERELEEGDRGEGRVRETVGRTDGRTDRERANEPLSVTLFP